MLTLPTSMLFLRHASDGAKEGDAAFEGEILDAKPTASAAKIAAITPVATPAEKETLGAITPVGATAVAKVADALPTDCAAFFEASTDIWFSTSFDLQRVGVR